MNDRTVEFFRTALTVLGILLLVIFGSRAAAQARNMKLAGATYKSVFAVGTDILSTLGLNKAEAKVSAQPKQLANHVPAQIQTATPIASSAAPAASGVTTTSQPATLTVPAAAVTTSTSSSSSKSAAHGHASTKAQQAVSKASKHNSDDFANLWP